MNVKSLCVVLALCLSQISLLTADEKAAELTLDRANELYAEKSYLPAGMKFQAYLKTFPEGDARGQAGYRSGECLLKQAKQAKDLGQRKKLEDKAFKAFGGVVKDLPDGKYAAPSSYRIASLLYNRKEFAKAVPHFESAAEHTPKAKIRQSAQYYAGRSLKLSGQPMKAIATFKKVSEDGDDSNLYRNTSRMGIAKLYLELKKPQDALPFLKEIIDSKHTDGRAEAEKLLEKIEAESGEE